MRALQGPQVSQGDVDATGNPARLQDFPNMSQFASDNQVGIPNTAAASPSTDTSAIAQQTFLEFARRSAQPNPLQPIHGDELSPQLTDAQQRRSVLITSLASAGIGLLLYSFMSGKPILE